jgi:hypothetical protein
MAASLGDDVLAEILIRLPTLADLGRASVACATFRRVIAEPAFLRRLHALHPPSLVGDTTAGGFHPVEPPHPSAPASRALERAADFAFSFLPGPAFWLVRDARGGRFVLDRADDAGPTTTIAVCEPL